MTGAEFKAARERLGLTYSELGAILGGIRADTIRRKWELDKPGPSPMACQIVGWMLEGYRPPEWPQRLASSQDDLVEALSVSLADCLIYARDQLDQPGFKSGAVAVHVIRAEAALRRAGWSV